MQKKKEFFLLQRLRNNSTERGDVVIEDYPKLCMKKKELVELGFPRRMLEEISHMPGAKSPVWSGKGKGAGLIYIVKFLYEDIDKWKTLRN